MTLTWFFALLILLNITQAENEIDPSALEWFQRGEALIGTEEEYSERQAEYFEKAAELAPQFAAARFNLVLIYLRRDRLDLALQHADKFVELAPEDVRGLQLRAEIYRKRGELGLAITELEKASHLAPENHEVWQDLGSTLYQQHQLEESLVAYEEVLRLDTKPVEALFEIALVQQALGKYVDAAENCRRFLAIRPNDFQANFLLGIVLRLHGRTQEALQYLLKAESLDPNDMDVATELRNLYLELGNLAEAGKRVEKQEDVPVTTLINLGLVAKERQEWEEATRYFEEAAKKDPGNSSAWTHLGDVLARRGLHEEAVRAYEMAIEHDPDEFNSLLNLSTLYTSEQRTKEAVDLLRHAVELRPDSSLAHLNLALVQEIDGDDSEAQAHYLIAIEHGETNPVAHFRLAILFSRQSQVDVAIEHLSVAFERNAERYVPMVLNELRKVNSDLDSIRYTARFNELLNRYRQKLEKTQLIQ